MSEFLKISWNNGELKSNYYGTDKEKSGVAIGMAWNGGIDILIPRRIRACCHATGECIVETGQKIIREMRTGKEVQCECDSRWVKLTFDDGTKYPYMFIMGSEQFGNLPAITDNGKRREIRVWAYNENKRQMFKAITLPCIVSVA